MGVVDTKTCYVNGKCKVCGTAPHAEGCVIELVEALQVQVQYRRDLTDNGEGELGVHDCHREFESAQEAAGWCVQNDAQDASFELSAVALLVEAPAAVESAVDGPMETARAQAIRAHRARAEAREVAFRADQRELDALELARIMEE